MGLEDSAIQRLPRFQKFPPPRQEFFETIDVDPSDAKGLLEVIDIDGNGKEWNPRVDPWEEKGETFSSRIWSRRGFYNPNGGGDVTKL